MKDGLSEAAKAVAGGVFGGMPVGECALVLPEHSYRATRECKDALNELVIAGVISCEPLDDNGGIQYKALVDCHEYFVWMGNEVAKGNPRVSIRIMEPIKRERKTLVESRWEE